MSPQWSPQQLSPQWLFGNSRTWTHDVRLHIASTNEPKRVLNKLSKEHNISGHKWPTTYRVLEFNRSKMSVIYLLSWKQCALPFITTMALWQLMHLGTWCCTVIMLWCNSCTWTHDIPLPCDNHSYYVMLWWQLTKCHVAKYMSCPKPIVVITGRAHCFMTTSIYVCVCVCVCVCVYIYIYIYIHMEITK